MKIRDGLTWTVPVGACPGCEARRVARIGHDADFRAVAQPVGAVDDDLVARIDARRDLHLVALGHAGLHHADFALCRRA